MPTITSYDTADSIQTSSLLLNTTSGTTADTVSNVVDHLAEAAAGLSTPGAPPFTVNKGLKGLGVLSIVMGAAVGALDIAQMFQPGDSDKIGDAINRVSEKIDGLEKVIDTELAKLHTNVLAAIQHSSFEGARVRIAHAEQIMKEYVAGYSAAYGGFISCNGTIEGIYLAGANGTNTWIYQQDATTPAQTVSDMANVKIAKGLRVAPPFLSASQLNANDLPLSNGENTIYFQCTKATTGLSGFIASFSSFKNGASADEFCLTTYNSFGNLAGYTNDWMIYTSDTPIDIASISASAWQVPEDLGKYGSASTPGSISGIGTSEAHWIWGSDVSAAYAVIKCTVTYNLPAHQSILTYFRQINTANIVNYITDELADAIFSIYVNAINPDGYAKTGALKFVYDTAISLAGAAASAGTTATTTPVKALQIAKTNYYQLMQRGVTVLTFMRVMREQILYLQANNVTIAYDLTPQQIAVLNTKMNYAKFGVKELFDCTLPEYNISELFISKADLLLPFTCLGQYLANGAMNANEYLLSENGLYSAIMQGDGNFVVYNGNVDNSIALCKPMWASGTQQGTSVSFRAVMQGDGNFVIYSPLKAEWASNTVTSGGQFFLLMQNDGNLVLYHGAPPNGTSPTWASNTVVT